MADGSVSTHRDVPSTCVPLAFGQDLLLDLKVPSDIGEPDELRAASTMLVRSASAVLRVALVRGDDHSDLPGTFSGAVEGAALLLQLALGFQEAADHSRTGGAS